MLTQRTCTSNYTAVEVILHCVHLVGSNYWQWEKCPTNWNVKLKRPWFRNTKHCFKRRLKSHRFNICFNATYSFISLPFSLSLWCLFGPCRNLGRAINIRNNNSNNSSGRRGRNFGPSKHVTLPTLCQSWKKDLSLRRWEGRAFSVLQRVSMLGPVQRYKAVLLHDTLPAPDCRDWWSVPNFALS